MGESDFLEKTTHATREDVEAGAIAFCTPATGSAPRRRPAGSAEHPDQPAPRPEWEPTANSNSSNDISAFEKRMICKVRDSLSTI